MLYGEISVDLLKPVDEHQGREERKMSEIMAFLIVWAVFFMGTLLAIPDASSYETWLQRAIRAAGYSFVFCVVVMIFGKILGISSSGDEFGETYYRR